MDIFNATHTQWGTQQRRVGSVVSISSVVGTRGSDRKVPPPSVVAGFGSLGKPLFSALSYSLRFSRAILRSNPAAENDLVCRILLANTGSERVSGALVGRSSAREILCYPRTLIQQPPWDEVLFANDGAGTNGQPSSPI